MNNIFIHNTTRVDYADIGKGTKIWHWSHICDKAVIGENCTIGQNVYIGPKVRIGSGCKIQNNVYIPEGIIIGDDVFIGPGVTFTNIKRPDARIEQKDKFLETVVGDHVVIGANATILPGLRLKKNCFIGAGSVVTRNIEEDEMVVGNPARHFYDYRGRYNECYPNSTRIRF